MYQISSIGLPRLGKKRNGKKRAQEKMSKRAEQDAKANKKMGLVRVTVN